MTEEEYQAEKARLMKTLAVRAYCHRMFELGGNDLRGTSDAKRYLNQAADLYLQFVADNSNNPAFVAARAEGRSDIREMWKPDPNAELIYER
jgi:hypothetical protein